MASHQVYLSGLFSPIPTLPYHLANTQRPRTNRKGAIGSELGIKICSKPFTIENRRVFRRGKITTNATSQNGQPLGVEQ